MFERQILKAISHPMSLLLVIETNPLALRLDLILALYTSMAEALPS